MKISYEFIIKEFKKDGGDCEEVIIQSFDVNSYSEGKEKDERT